MPCFEIVDSRIKDWKIKIQDTVADNASCGVFVLGDRKVARAKLDLTLRHGAGEERRDRFHRLRRRRAGLAGQRRGLAGQHPGPPGHPLKAGEVMLSGSQSALVPVTAGDINAP
jgi:2-oxopent-4-enoate/cis-2-oxohex-4-enoate hydratase